MNILQLSYRQFNALLFTGCIILLAIALYMEHSLGLEPCPLCIMQRVAFIFIALFALIATIHDPKKNIVQTIYSGLIGLATLIGIGLASRQVWLQHLPKDQVPECGPGLEYMLDIMPLSEVLSTVLSGDGSCAEVQWTFLGLSIPEWTLIVFIGILISVLIHPFLRKKYAVDQ